MTEILQFAGGIPVEAALAIGPNKGTGEDYGLDQLQSLVEWSLLRKEASTDEPRLATLETLREFGLEQLDMNGETDAIRQAHAEWFLALAEDADHIRYDPGPGEEEEWLNRFERESGNFRTALKWAIQRGEAETGLRFIIVLWYPWMQRGYHREGRDFIQQVLRLRSGTSSTSVERRRKMLLRAKALGAAGNFATWYGDGKEAQALWEESLAIQRKLKRKVGITACLIHLGIEAAYEGDWITARRLFTDAIDIDPRRAVGYDRANHLYRLGNAAMELDDFQSARVYLNESLKIARAIRQGHEGIIYSNKTSLGLLSFLEAVKNGEQVEEKYTAARNQFRESLVFAREHNHVPMLIDLLGNVTCLAAAERQSLEALALAGATTRWRNENELRWAQRDRHRFELANDAAQEQLNDEQASAVALAEGKTMTLEQAVAHALKVLEA